MVAASWSDLLASGPSKAIVQTELGEPLDVIPNFVWTNTGEDGISLGSHDCNGWTSNNVGLGSIGFTEKGAEWTHANTQQLCSDFFHLYCFQGEE